MAFLTEQFIQLLVFLNGTFGNLGWAIIAFTLIVRSFLLPLTLSSLKSQNKMKKLQPELKKLTKKHGKDKKALQKDQLALYQKHNINPMAGCLPQIFQLFILIVLYRALLAFLDGGMQDGSGLSFFWLNLGQPDRTYILPIVAAASQFALSLMISPGAEIRDVVSNKSKKKKVKLANKKEEDTAEMAASMQQQMLFIMPIMTGFMAAQFPSGIALYWVIATIFSVGQQYYVSGWGGLTTYPKRVINLLKIKVNKK